MPVTTSDPISSLLQKTFGGIEHKREGLMRGGNSASAAAVRPFSSSVDKQLQSTAKHGLIAGGMEHSSIHFDSPTRFKSDAQSLHPKVVVLNPKSAAAAASANAAAATAQQSKDQAKKDEGIPQPKVID